MPLKDVELKKTVNLPRTDFPMKANLPQTEPRILARWEEMDLYRMIRQARAGRPSWVLHDGPPYANGNIHLGTAFNKILKDFIVKSRTMAGFDSPYVPGWDCHGLPIENKVDAELGPRKAQMTAAEIRGECRKYAQKFVEIHRREFKRLGVFGDWERPYLTMSAGYEAVIAGAFVDFLDKGYVYKGLRPVHWCMRDRTALAEAEVEYEHHSSPSIWVRFRLASDPAGIHPSLKARSVWGVIWTTTPWTIPANMAIAFHPAYEYVAVAERDDVYIIARDLWKTTAEKCGWPETKVLASFPGRVLEGAVFRHPFLERDSAGVLAEHVTLDQGTGAVHTAPGHGQEDYFTARQYGIATYCPVDAAGCFFHAEGAAGVLPEQIIGKSVWEANPVVVGILRERGALLAEGRLDHSYPHCWRCHNPTIFRATEQWFIGMAENGLREKALEAIKSVKWTPGWGLERMSGMVGNRPDWCISRQRVWGVPIVVFYCEGCGEPLTDRKRLDRVVGLFREHTADVWYDRTEAGLLDKDARCGKCGGGAFRKGTDILDVWFDSGSSHLGVLNQAYGLPWPCDLYVEGPDQHRGWFQSSLLVGVGLKGGSPYRQCATHGWTLDGEGRAMSKSVGNIIEPDTIVRQYGAEVLRLWVASQEFTEDVRISETILARLSEAYRKLRNTFRYALGNLCDFDPARDAVPAGEMPELDQWVLIRAEGLVRNCLAWYEEMAFHKVYHAVYDFAISGLSALYFDVLKDRLYTAAPASRARRSAQTVLHRLTYALVRLLAPILSFTTEEVWGHFSRPAGEGPSVHLSGFPDPAELTKGLTAQHRKRARQWDRLMEVREHVLKSLEAARQEKYIGAPLEACVHLRAGADLYPLLEQYAAELPGLFIVSQVEVTRQENKVLSVHVARAAGVKCERCWKYTADVGSASGLPTVCAACAAVVAQVAGN